MAKLKPWYQVVTPREDLRDNRPLDASEFAVHLDHIHHGAAAVPVVYRDPREFFERTVWTRSLVELASQVARRLNGVTVETSAVFNMATQFGGGKTHSLAAIYHLARGGFAASTWSGVPEVLDRAEVESLPEAAVAVFVGKGFDSLAGRGEEGEPRRHTPWGEIAWQLGGEKSYRAVAEHDAEFIEPKGDAIRAMLPVDRPVVILMDEIISYVSTYRGRGYGDRLYNFIDCLAEEARGLSNVVVVVSIPASELEYTADDEKDEHRFKKMLDRVGRPISMSSDTEVTEIVRRRLFEWTGLNDDAKRTIRAYADWAKDHSSDLAEMGGKGGESADDLFRASFPFHPTVISVFEQKWQSLPRFQRTRGVLRLLALWVARAYQDEHLKAFREPLITLGSAPLADQSFRDAVFEQLGSDRLVTPVTTDIAGKTDSHALRLDREGTPDIKQARLHQKVASAIFFESNGGQSLSKAEASQPELRAALGGPELDLGNIETALDGLLANCYYLVGDKNRYRFGLAPNLNQMLVHHRANVATNEIDERVKREIVDLFAVRPQDTQRRKVLPDLRHFIKATNDIPDRPQLTFAVLGFDTPHGDPATTTLMEAMIRQCGQSARTFKSAIFFCVPDRAASASDAARSVIAWEIIAEDTSATERLDEAQRKNLKVSLERAKKDLREELYRSYRHVYLLGANNSMAHEDLGQINSSADPSITNLILAHLITKDVVVEYVGARRIVQCWPPAIEGWSTKSVREAFYSSPVLPRLLHGDSISRTIAEGVSNGAFGYAHRELGKNLLLDRFEEAMSESDVEIGDDFFILKPDAARRLKEPPRLAKVQIRPEAITLRPGEAAAFTAVGRDQYDQEFSLESVEWSASGGMIAADGRFTAGEVAGHFGVSVVADRLTADTAVRIVSTSGASQGTSGRGSGAPGSGAGGKQLVLWSGEVPPQKWMNFYTKVLSRFATTSGLRLKVSFEAAPQSEHADRSVEETRTALRELGLTEDVTLGEGE